MAHSVGVPANNRTWGIENKHGNYPNLEML